MKTRKSRRNRKPEEKGEGLADVDPIARSRSSQFHSLCRARGDDGNPLPAEIFRNFIFVLKPDSKFARI
jgi:hypothetical protein